MSFANLKKRNIADLQAKLKSTQQQYEKDDIWTIAVDKSGNGSAIIRFLPEAENNDTPYALQYQHSFKYNGKWFIETCPTTAGKQFSDCYCCTKNNELWATGLESNQKLVRDRKRKTNYFMNILVIKHPGRPEDEGKVFKYRCGTKIYEKILEKINPDPTLGEEPFDPFDFYTGANFRLKARNVNDQRNYDQSVFDSPSALFGGDDTKLEEVYKQLNDLRKYSSNAPILSMAEMKAKYEKVCGGASTQSKSEDFDDFEDDIPPAPKRVASVTKQEDDDDEKLFEDLLDD